MNRSGHLPVQKAFRGFEPRRDRWRHKEPGDDGQRSRYKYGRKIGNHLQTIVLKPPGARREIKGRVLDGG